jgi:hypothetical protein
MGLRASAVVLSVVVAITVLACDRGSPVQPSQPCSVAIDPTTNRFDSSGGTGIITVTSPDNCVWNAVASAQWISILTGGTGTGSGSIKYSIAPNTSAQPRTGTIAVGGQPHLISQDAQGACSYALSASSTTFGSAGGSGTVTISTSSSCGWTMTSGDAWIVIAGGASGQGSGTAAFNVSANAGAASRTGLIHVADQTVSITQSAAGCSYTVTPQSAAFGSEGGQGAISVSAPSGCTWTAATSDPWISVVQGASGTADGTVTYAVAKQTTADARNGVVHVADVDVRVIQSGDVSSCQYSVAPVAFTPCMPATTISAMVATGASCPWSATSNASWAAVSSGQTMTGSGAITVSIADNYDAPRSGLVLVRWPTPTLGQNLQIAQAGCSYAVSTNAFSFAAAGGSGSFDVYQSSDPYTCGGPLQDACVWTPTSDSNWIVVSTGTTRGDNPVHFVVSTNTTGVTRSGSIRVKDKTVVVTQSGS